MLTGHEVDFVAFIIPTFGRNTFGAAPDSDAVEIEFVAFIGGDVEADSALTPGPSPKGRGESILPKRGRGWG
jgi:hypothetical protein